MKINRNIRKYLHLQQTCRMFSQLNSRPAHTTQCRYTMYKLLCWECQNGAWTRDIRERKAKIYNTV